MDAFLKVVRDIALLVARIVAGVVLVAHGWQRWQIIGLDKQEALLEAAGLPAPYGLAVATVIFEIIGGTLLVFGLATPLIGLGMVVMVAVGGGIEGLGNSIVDDLANRASGYENQ